MAKEEATEAERIRRLLILLLLKLGATSEEIGAVLGIDSSGIRREFSVSKIKKIEFTH